MALEDEVLEMINRNFLESDQAFVIQELELITLDHVMAKSALNLYNTRISILKIAQSDKLQVKELSECAKIDFRDVILWAHNL